MIKAAERQRTQEAIQDKLETSFLRRASIKKNQISLDMDVKKVLNENVFIYGHIVLDLHEDFGVKKEYEALTEFEVFATPRDLISYIMEKTEL